MRFLLPHITPSLSSLGEPHSPLARRRPRSKMKASIKATRICACSNSPSQCMWTVPPRSWPLTSATPGKNRGHASGRPSGWWCRSFPGPGWWSQVQSGRLRSPAAPCGTPAPSRSDGSRPFRLSATRRGSGICVSCDDGGRLRERRTGLGGWPRREKRSHSLDAKTKRRKIGSGGSSSRTFEVIHATDIDVSFFPNWFILLWAGRLKHGLWEKEEI